MVSQVRESIDDDQLFGALSEALQARRAVPVRFVQAATLAYAWHDVDAELAGLSRDRNPDHLPASVRHPRGPLLRAYGRPAHLLTGRLALVRGQSGLRIRDTSLGAACWAGLTRVDMRSWA